MVEFWQVILSILSAGGIGAAAAVGLCKRFGERWIDNRFDERLQQHKHEQDKEIQRLRAEIDSMLSGTIKLQERDFQILPEAWQLLHESYGRAESIVHPLQEIPDIAHLSEDKLSEFLDNSWLTETQKKDIIASTNRNKLYQELNFWHKIFLAKKALGELQNYVAKHEIFFPQLIQENIASYVTVLHSALIDREYSHDDPTVFRRSASWKTIKDNVKPLYADIKIQIRDHLRSHGAPITQKPSH